MYHVEPYKTFIFFDILPLRRNKKMAPLTTVRGVRLKKNRLGGLQLDVVGARIPNPSDASVGSSFQQRGRRAIWVCLKIGYIPNEIAI